jgi:hypothetical protein
MSADLLNDDWWSRVEREVAHSNLGLRCSDVIFRMTQMMASKDYGAVLHAMTVRIGSRVELARSIRGELTVGHHLFSIGRAFNFSLVVSVVHQNVNDRMKSIYKCVWAAYRLFVRCNFGSYTLRGFACPVALYIQGVLLDLLPARSSPKCQYSFGCRVRMFCNDDNCT